MSIKGPVFEAVRAKDRAAHDKALADYRRDHEADADRWLASGIYRYAMKHPQHAGWVAAEFPPFGILVEGEQVLHQIRLRCAYIETLEGVERYKGCLTPSTMEASNFLRSHGVADVSTAPPDLQPRIVAALAVLAQMETEDRLYCYTHGAYWLVEEAEVHKEMVPQVEEVGYEVVMVPFLRKRCRQDDDEHPPAAKVAKPL